VSDKTLDDAELRRLRKLLDDRLAKRKKKGEG
jgi:hypothetical protein